MVKIFDFETGRLKLEIPEDENAETQIASVVEKTPKKKGTQVDKETYLLWMFSKDIDMTTSRYVLEHGLKVEELATIMANRLGSLIATSEKSETLVEFCEKVVKRSLGHHGRGEGAS